MPRLAVFSKESMALPQLDGQKHSKSFIFRLFMVGAAGFEPATSTV
jgi:hypothetical protein